MAELVLENVSKEFPGGVRAVNGLSLRVADGELLAVVGPSGCGKTTLLRLIAGLERPDGGTIRIGSRDVSRLPPVDRNVAMVFQGYALLPHLDVFANLAFGLRLRGTPRSEIDERVRAAAGRLGIEDLLARRPDEISGGQQQRVALGRALVRACDCYLLDEPLAQLDAALRHQLRDEIRALHRQLGRPIVCVTHDQEEALALGQRIAVMHQGRIEQCGTPLEVFRRPRNRFVAGFVGSPPMNFLPGTLTESDAGCLAFRCGTLRLALDDTAAALAKAAPRDVVLGVRPGAIRPAATADGNNGASFVARVDSLESLGDTLVARLTIAPDIRLAARFHDSRELRPGSEARFSIQPKDVHLFSPDAAGENLLVADDPLVPALSGR